MRMMRVGGVCLLLLALLAFSFVPGGDCKDVYVDGSSTSETEDGSKEYPYHTMNKTLENVSAGDRVLVAGGTYSGSMNRDLLIQYPLEIRAEDFNNLPTFDLENAGSFATFDPDLVVPYSVSTSTIIGFVFQNGKGHGTEASVLTIVSGSLSVSFCSFENNVGDQNGAVVITSGQNAYVPNLVAIGASTFRGNTATNGGAITVSHRSKRTVLVGGCRFESNIAEENGGAIYSHEATMTVVDSNFTSNVANKQFGGAISSSSSTVRVYTSRFVSNDAAEQGGGAHFNDGTFTVSKSFFQENTLHDAPDQGNLRQGAGLFVSGSAIIEGSTFSLNDCSDTMSTSQGGGLVLDGDDSSWISNSTFEGNKGFFGSDVAVLAGTTAYFTQTTFERTEEEGMYQLYSSGSLMFENCDFKQAGAEQSLLSVYGTGNGVFDFEWFPGAPDFYIEELTLTNNALIKTSTNLNVSVCSMHGGLIMSTASAETRTFGVLEAMIASPIHASVILGVTSFNMVNYGTLTLATTFTFHMETGWGTFTNKGQLFMGEGSTFSTDQFVNEGLLSVDTRGAINADFHTTAAGNITLNQVVKGSTASLIITQSASLDGTLEANLENSTAKDFKKGSQIPLISYNSLAGRFKTFETSVKSNLVYDSTTLYMSNKKENSDGLGGGEIALTIIGALVGGGILVAAIWYYVIRDPNSGNGSFAVLGSDGEM